MRNYYDARAEAYERLYNRADPVREREHGRIARELRARCRGRRVMEVVFGHHEWTEVIASTAQSTVSVDVAPAPRQAPAPTKLSEGVMLAVSEPGQLAAVPGDFDAAVVCFALSQLRRSVVPSFVAGLHGQLGRGASIFMADDVMLPDVAAALTERGGDTFARVELNDAGEHELLKNFYDLVELRAIFEPRATQLAIEIGRCFWWLSYRVV